MHTHCTHTHMDTTQTDTHTHTQSHTHVTHTQIHVHACMHTHARTHTHTHAHTHTYIQRSKGYSTLTTLYFSNGEGWTCKWSKEYINMTQNDIQQPGYGMLLHIWILNCYWHNIAQNYKINEKFHYVCTVYVYVCICICVTCSRLNVHFIYYNTQHIPA